ncbi:hypothetical protein AC249_AIPGENE18986 [Exaiptasia diaphana]|nr:hypothetical protein AC249_AIPGENE18986 [Exaiptasia diaphana]
MKNGTLVLLVLSFCIAFSHAFMCTNMQHCSKLNTKKVVDQPSTRRISSNKHLVVCNNGRDLCLEPEKRALHQKTREETQGRKPRIDRLLQRLRYVRNSRRQR